MLSPRPSLTGSVGSLMSIELSTLMAELRECTEQLDPGRFPIFDSLSRFLQKEFGWPEYLAYSIAHWSRNSECIERLRREGFGWAADWLENVGGQGVLPPRFLQNLVSESCYREFSQGAWRQSKIERESFNDKETQLLDFLRDFNRGYEKIPQYGSIPDDAFNFFIWLMHSKLSIPLGQIDKALNQKTTKSGSYRQVYNGEKSSSRLTKFNDRQVKRFNQLLSGSFALGVAALVHSSGVAVPYLPDPRSIGEISFFGDTILSHLAQLTPPRRGLGYIMFSRAYNS